MVVLPLELVSTLLSSVQALRNVVLFVLLAPYDNEQSDLVHRVAAERNMDEIPLYE